MRDDEDGAPAHERLYGRLHQPLAARVQRRRRLVQNQDGRILPRQPKLLQTLTVFAPSSLLSSKLCVFSADMALSRIRMCESYLLRLLCLLPLLCVKYPPSSGLCRSSAHTARPGWASAATLTHAAQTLNPCKPDFQHAPTLVSGPKLAK